MSMLPWIPILLCSLWTILGLFALARVTRGKRLPFEGALPPVSVLKPLCGADADLEENLESFFRQDASHFELIFGVTSSTDPALPVVRALIARYPNVAAKLVVHRGGAGSNPKVCNLRGMIPHAAHDLLLISDSNILAPRDYVTDAAQTWSDPHCGLVTNAFAGFGENGIGSALENVQLNGFCAEGTALPTMLGDAAVVGKSMLFSRKTLARLGGLERVANVLAEDFVMGKMFQHAGYRVRVARCVLRNVTRNLSLSGFLNRHLRWSMLRVRLRPATYLLEPLTSPLALLPAAWAALGPWGLAWTAVMLMLRDLGGWLLLRGGSGAWAPLLLSPVREILILLVWAYAPFKRHVSWRGHRLRLGTGTLLFNAR